MNKKIISLLALIVLIVIGVGALILNLPSKDISINRGWTLKHVLDVSGKKVVSVSAIKDDVEIPIGTTINYTVDGYEGSWKVLGVDRMGKLKIVTASNVVSSQPLGSEDDIDVAKLDYLDATIKLDSICKGLDKNKNAVANSARSINIEDIDAITKFDKTSHRIGNLFGYGNEVTYKWQETNYPLYTYGEGTIGVLDNSHELGFTYFKDEKWTTSLKEETNETIATLINNHYSYAGTTYLDDKAAYDMLFNSGNYWLASRYTLTDIDVVEFGVYSVYGGGVDGYNLCYSDGGSTLNSFAVKAVVLLKSDVEIEYNDITKTCIIK